MNRRGIDTRYALKVDTIYEQTGHRNYLSIWLERFIIKWVNEHTDQTTWTAEKVENKGRLIHSRYTGGKMDGKIASSQWVKNHNITPGEPDLMCKSPTKGVMYFEIKIGSDRLSKAQKKFIAQGWKVYVVRTVDEFLYFWDKLNA